MKLSRFNLYIPGFPRPGSTLVHNTFSGGFVELDDEDLARLRAADRGEPMDAQGPALAEDLDLRDPDVGVVVDDYDSEERAFAAWFERRRARATVDALVSVNLACNFDCSYCCQASVLDGSVMTEAHCDATADWLAARAEQAAADQVNLTFCGGEPLLHPHRIARLAQRLGGALRSSGRGFEFGLITNGWLLDQRVLDLLVPLGLSRAQITLDGDDTTHDLTRPLKKRSESSFPRVFANAVAASKRIRVGINGNYRDDTVGGFAPLLARLDDAGLPDHTRVTFSPALTALGAPEGSGTCSWSASGADYQVALHDEVIRHGFSTGGPLNVVGPCELHDRHSFAIGPDGAIYKCPGFLGEPAWAIGHVTRGLEGELYDRILAAAPAPGCDGCAHRPGCGGGCLASEWLRRGELSGVSCEREYFERVAPHALVRSYLLATEPSPARAHAAFPPPPTRLPPVAGRVLARGARSPALRVVA